jgi:secreted PhoX family phosphatase
MPAKPKSRLPKIDDLSTLDMSCDDFDEQRRAPLKQTGFDAALRTALAKALAPSLSRRHMLTGLIAVGLSSFLRSTAKLAAKARTTFTPIATSSRDTVRVPPEFNWHVVAKWGDNLWSDAKAKTEHNGRSPNAAEQKKTFGDNLDGLDIFSRDGRTLLVANNEYVNRRSMFANRKSQRPETPDDIAKGLYAHGLTVTEIQQIDGHWQIVKDSDVNRRITPETRMEITGPAKFSAHLATSYDPDASIAQGTWNNCGNGRTPWGTYLSCEENFNVYFSGADDTSLSTEQKRYGLGGSDWGYRWAKIDDRFDLQKEPNEPNRAGYVIEFDPWDPHSTPRKLTALGRFKHENAEVVLAANNRVVVYMGDDERGEYLYRFVSDKPYIEGQPTNHLLEQGTLYAAKFEDDGTGAWLALTPEATGMPLDEISVFTRIAATKLGAITMDRPEWVAAHPDQPTVYCALSNNKSQRLGQNLAGVSMQPNGPNPRPSNRYGQIIKWTPEKGDHAALNFSWAYYALAGNPLIHTGPQAGSENVTTANMFHAPDGLSFDSQGKIWIRTDGNFSSSGKYKGMGNNQMLVGDANTGEIQRFMTAPNEAEISGLSWSPDRATMFVGIQHPGAKYGSVFPDGEGHLPRSAVIAVRRNDDQAFG